MKIFTHLVVEIAKNNWRGKNTLVALLCFQMHTKRPELNVFHLWVRITSFSKTTLLQRESFFTIFYTVSSSPLLVTKWSFMLKNIFWVITNGVTCLTLSTDTVGWKSILWLPYNKWSTVLVRKQKENHAISRQICVDDCILLLKHLSNLMHFITNGYKR